MSKTKDLLILLDELAEVGRKLIDISEEIKNCFSGQEVKEPTIPLLNEETKEIKTYSFEEVRGLMANLASSGHKDKARELLAKYGANKLSDISPSNYNSLVKDINEVTNV